MRGRFSTADLEPTGGTKGKSNTPRWEATARFALYVGLKKKGLINAVSKNQWVITANGRKFVSLHNRDSLRVTPASKSRPV